MEKCPVCGESRDICYNVKENVYVCGRCGVKFEMYRYDEKSETIKPAVPLKEDICPVCGETEEFYFDVEYNMFYCYKCGYKQPPPTKEDICPCCGEKENITIIHERICNNCGINF